MIWGVILGTVSLLLLGIYWHNRSLKQQTEYFHRTLHQHVIEVENIYRQMRGIRHDYKNQLQVMKTYLQWNQTKDLSDYLDQMEHELNNVDTIVQTGNVAIDAIINSKLSLAKEAGIQLDAKAIIPENTPFQSLDMGILIGNLLSNAYESALKTDQAFIRLYIAPIKGNLYISCTNSTREKIINLATTKLGFDHGFGLSRMNQIVSKYNGWVNRASEPGVFSCEITLPLASENVPLVSN